MLDRVPGLCFSPLEAERAEVAHNDGSVSATPDRDQLRPQGVDAASPAHHHRSGGGAQSCRYRS